MKILARVNNEEISFEKWLVHYEDYLESLKVNAEAKKDEFDLSIAGFQLLEDLIHRCLLVQYAKDQNMVADEREITKRLDKLRKDLGEGFSFYMEEYSLDENLLYKDIENDILIEELLKKELASNLNFMDEDLMAFYNVNKDHFLSKESVHVKHILLSTDQAKTDNERSEIRERAMEIKAQIEGGASFEKLAELYSSCPSKTRGGDLGFIELGSIDEEFESVAFSIDLNKLSNVVESDFGYHILKVIEKRDNHTPAFQSVKAGLRDKLQTILSQERYEILIERLYENANVEIFEFTPTNWL